MRIDELLMNQFLNERNLLNQYKTWKKQQIQQSLNTIVHFCLNNGKYDFEITFSPEQLNAFINWSKTLNPDYLFATCTSYKVSNNLKVSENWTDPFISGKELTELFELISTCNDNYFESETSKVHWTWSKDGLIINQFRSCSDFKDLESECCAFELVSLCENWYTADCANGKNIFL